MSREESRCQSLASCGAVLIAFNGVCHEFAGHLVFPWGPATLGGPLGWHGLGLFGIAIGLLLLGGTLRVIKFPVFPFALLIAAIGLALVIYAAVAHRQFHMFALAVCFAGVAAACFHRRASQLAAAAGSIA